MISICWACSIRFAVISSTRPVSLAIARSTTRNRLAVPSVPFRPAFSLNRIREAGRGGRHHHLVGGVLGIPLACGLASFFSLIRYGKRVDDVPGRIHLRAVSMAAGGVPCQGASFISI